MKETMNYPAEALPPIAKERYEMKQGITKTRISLLSKSETRTDSIHEFDP